MVNSASHGDWQASPALLTLVRVKPGSEAIFAQNWRALRDHCRHVSGMLSHVQNVVQAGNVSMPVQRGPWVVDGIGQMEFDSGESLRRMLADKRFAQFIAAHREVASHCLTLVALKYVVIAPRACPDGQAPLVKRMSLLQKGPHTTPRQFRSWWLNQHGPKVAQLRSLCGANQYHVMQSQLEFGTLAQGFERVPDGVTELLLPDLESMRDTFPADGSAITASASEMIAAMTPLLVSE